ncbi:PREDICTED: probable serine/threonine-protein kinase PknB isoform X1 [Cyprinodon variegatus]|uniref:Probable serine/threonine-protein kinase PknB n=1 Tax=Cyprinodon variegatus TaxID=28743 RepID=A0A3Q2CUW0_CYPVA|nr:PREDICTED: probable serine/threonine-protein kinase PknB isoform X1 [Cyprinodon variegatus]
MGGAQSKLKQEGYVEKQKTENYIVATKEDNTVLIKMVPLPQQCRQSMAALTSEIKTLQEMKHPHLVNINNSFEDENQNIYYVVMEDCQGGNLADKIIEMPEPPEESEILSYIVEICMALKVIHEACLLHKDLMPKNVLFTEFGLVCLGGFGNIHENSKNLSSEPTINYLAPEVFTDGTYDPKSDMWSVGCILYELCTKQRAFSAETAIKLMPKIISADFPQLPSDFSFEICDLVGDLLKKDPRERPTATEMLQRPIIIRCLIEKCKTTVEELQTKLDTLRALADGLERIHEGTTIASLTGGVIGAVGGITSIVGLILSPFTLGASLIVTGIGVGVGAVGGVTAGASNITNMVNQSSDRKTVHSIIKELEQKISAVVSWLVEISYSFQAISSIYADVCDDDGNFSNENIKKIGLRAGRNLSGITELIRLVRVVNIGKIAAQTSRAVRVAEVATGILSGLFVAVDIFFIAMDAKEIHDIKQARVAETSAASPQSADEMDNSAQTSDETMLINSSLMQESDPAENNQTMDQATPKKAEIRSEVMKFVKSVREAAENMEKVLAELKTVIQSIPSFLEHNEMEWQNMELM